MSTSESGGQAGVVKPRRRVDPRLALAVCGLAIFMDVGGTGIVIPAIPEFAALFGSSEADMGLAFSAFGLAFLLSVLPIGALVDRTGRPDLIVGGAMVALALTGVSFALAPTIWVFALGQALHGVGSAAAWVSAQPLAARLASERERKGIWFASVTIAMGLGLLSGPLVGTVGGLRVPFVIYAAAACAAAVAALVVLRGVAERDGEHEGVGLAKYLRVLRTPGVLAACLAILVLYADVAMLEVLFPLHMDAHGYAKGGIGVLFFWLALSMVVSQPLTGRWMDRVGVVFPTVLALLAMAVTLVLAVMGVSFAQWVPVFMVLGVANGIPVSATMMLIAVSSRPADRGVAYALWNFSFSIGYLAGPAFAGSLAEASAGWGSVGGVRAPFFVLAAVTVAAAPAFALLVKPHSRVSLSPAE